MTQIDNPGLGEVLRHLTELLDRGSEAHYHDIGLETRARYTPLLRRLGEGDMTVSALQQKLRITQGAISQTVKLMQQEGLVRRVAAADRRSQKIRLTQKGQALRRQLTAQWRLRFNAIDRLEQEIGVPLRRHLDQAIEALEGEGFDRRLHRLSVHQD